MKIFLTAHIKQHAGDILLECQDSFDYNLEKKTFSVSDGVSQAYRPELWSRLLTSSFVNNPDTFLLKSEDNKYIINPRLGLKGAWTEEVNRAYENATSQERFLLDMKKEAIDIGAATFIGVQLTSAGIEYFAIGDSVLFFYDYETGDFNAISSMIPDDGNMIFNNSPEYIDTNEKCNGNIIHGILPYKKGILFLATDALSDWIVERRSLDVQETLKTLMQISDHDTYDKFIDDIRTESQPKKLKDDDTTFLSLEFTEIDGDYMDIIPTYAVPFKTLVYGETINELRKKSEELDTLRSAKFNIERTLKKKEKDYDKISSENETQLQELSRCQSEIKTLRQSIGNLDSQIEQLKNQVSAANSQVATLSQQKRSLELEKGRLDSEIKRLTKDLTTARDKNGQLVKENKRLETLNKKEKTSTPSGLPASNGNGEQSEILRLQNELNQSQANFSRAQKELETLKEHIRYIKSSFDNDGRAYDSDLIRLFSMTFGASPIVDVTYIESRTFKTTKDGGFEI